MKKILAVALILLLTIPMVFAQNIDAAGELASLTNYFKTNDIKLDATEAIWAFAQDGQLFDTGIVMDPEFPDPAENVPGNVGKQSLFAYKVFVKATVLGVDPKSLFPGVDPIQMIIDSQDPGTGLLGGSEYNHWFCMMALETVGAAYDREAAIQYLLLTQDTDGGWCGAWGADPDSSAGTAIILSRLASDPDMPADVADAIDDALKDYFDFVKNTQDAEGTIGWGGFAPSASSTFFTICALLDCGEDVFSTEYKEIGNSITKFKNAEGFYSNEYAPADFNGFATTQAAMALSALKKGKSPFAELMDTKSFAAQTAERARIAKEAADAAEAAREKARLEELARQEAEKAAAEKKKNPKTGEQ